ncbi:MAG: thioredoxin [Firmicutes bacterium]|nr:thioredoxin [Bacillota bacterium]
MGRKLSGRINHILLVLGTASIIIGISRREFGTILLNALILCTSCIGLR